MSGFAKKYGTKYLNGEDLGPSPRNYTIEWLQEDVQVGDDVKDLLKLRELEKSLPLNLTQGRALIDALGDNLASYPGRQIGMFGQKIASGQFKGKWTIVITPVTDGPMPVHQAIPTAEQGSILSDDEMPNFRTGKTNYSEEAFQ